MACDGEFARKMFFKPGLIFGYRYVIDEVQGSVDVLCQFDSLGMMPDSHEIRVIDGKVKYVHTITALKIG
jgi:hypothetical protein